MVCVYVLLIFIINQMVIQLQHNLNSMIHLFFSLIQSAH